MAINIQDELPVKEIPSIEKWSENFLFVGFDPLNRIGFFVHLGRWSVDTRFWREQIMVYLPNGDVIAHRAFGRGDEARGPAGSLLRFTTEDEGASWRLRYRGPAQHSAAGAMAKSAFNDGLLKMLDFNIVFTGTHRIWDLGEMAKGEIGFSSHYEQPGRVAGTISYDGQSFSMDGAGHRDHSRGPRDLSPQVSHRWMQGHFSDGFSFAVMDSEVDRGGTIGESMSIAVLWDHDRIVYGKFSGVPRIDLDADTPLAPYTMIIESELGRMEIKAEPQAVSHLSVDANCECYFGYAPDPAHFIILDQPTIYHLNGKEGSGHAQRSIRFIDPLKGKNAS